MLLSGVDNHRNGYGTMEGDWAENQRGLRGYEGYLNFDVVAFPKLLQDNGYHTSIAGKWHQAYPVTEKSLWPGKRGFDRSFCLLQGGAGHFADQQPLFSFYKKTLYADDGEIVDKLPNNFYSSDYYTQKVIEYVDESVKLNKPFFSYLAFTAPHWPLQVPDEYIDLYNGRYDAGYEVLATERLARAKQLGIIAENIKMPPLSPNVLPWDELSLEEQKVSSRIMEIYAAMIERMDSNVGKLVEHLKSIGQYDNTLIIFMADNGAEGNSIWGIADTREWVADNFNNSIENIGRMNSYIFTGPSWAQVSTLPFKWYKTFSTEGGVRCPSIISYPKWQHNFGNINDDFISVMDLAPTILEFAGIDHSEKEYDGREIYTMDGISLISWLDGTEESAHNLDEAHCWELYGRRGVRKGDWKAELFDAPYGKDTWELYNIKVDPAELNDLALDNPEKLGELKAEWDIYAAEYNVTLPNEKVAYGNDEIWREE
jgi:arylsulfatase